MYHGILGETLACRDLDQRFEASSTSIGVVRTAN